MIRLLGAALLLLGALLAGQALTGLLRRKRAVLRELRGFVETLQAELLQRGTPLPELFAQTGGAFCGSPSGTAARRWPGAFRQTGPWSPCWKR